MALGGVFSFDRVLVAEFTKGKVSSNKAEALVGFGHSFQCGSYFHRLGHLGFPGFLQSMLICCRMNEQFLKFSVPNPNLHP